MQDPRMTQMPFRGGVVRVSAVPLPPARSAAVAPSMDSPPVASHGLGGVTLLGSSPPDAFGGFAVPGLDSMDLNDDDGDDNHASRLAVRV